MIMQSVFTDVERGFFTGLGLKESDSFSTYKKALEKAKTFFTHDLRHSNKLEKTMNWFDSIESRMKEKK